MRALRPLLLTAVLALGLLGAVPAASAAPIEGTTSNPVTAAPPVSRPHTAHCTVLDPGRPLE